MRERAATPPSSSARLGLGFTLVELLIVIAMIAILAALLLPALSRSKAQGQRIQCVNRLYQMGIALRMYADDNRFYPIGVLNDISATNYGGQVWYDSLAPYCRMQWTNRAFHCPSYQGMIVTGLSWLTPSGSYSYNVSGTGDPRFSLGGDGTSYPIWSGISASQVKVPSDMFAIADARIVSFDLITFPSFSQSTNIVGFPFMSWWSEPQSPRHGNGFNFLFCDGHVSLMKPSYFMNPTNSWQNWNGDHEAHMETWTGYWYNYP